MNYLLPMLLLLCLYALLSGYGTALATLRHQSMKAPEEQPLSVSRTIIHWFETPQREQRVASFFLGIRVLFYLAEGAILILWMQAWQISSFLKLFIPQIFSDVSMLFISLSEFLILFLLSSLMILIAEVLPQKIAVLNPERYLMLGYPVFSICYWLFAGLFHFLERVANLFFSGAQKDQMQANLSMSASLEIRDIVSDPLTANELPSSEREILSAVMDFNDMLVQQVTIPRTEVVAVEAQTPVYQALAICLEKGVTKLPVFIDQLDNIEGIVHLRDMVAKVQEMPECSLPVVGLIRETLFVPQAIPLHTLLRQFRSQHMHMAIVLDEFGGTAGIVTLEDLLEEVFGEILDPFETIAPSIQVQKDGSFLIDGRTPLDEFNEYFHTHLTAPDYQTVAGYMLAQLKRIPQTGDSFEDTQNKLVVSIKKMERLRIAQVLVQFYIPPVLGKTDGKPDSMIF